ncbi:hypothetical protein ABTZ03_42670 [Kitasatospora sp. NPDC096077]
MSGRRGQRSRSGGRRTDGAALIRRLEDAMATRRSWTAQEFE